VLDYFGVGKAGYFYLKRVFSPVLASFKALSGEGLELWITNDSLSPVQETISVKLGTFSGRNVWTEDIPVDVLASSSQVVQCWDSDRAASSADRYLIARSASETFPVNRHFFAPIKDLQRIVSPATMTVRTSDSSSLVAHVSAPPDSYAFFVHLSSPVTGVRYSDNFFDLEPGEKRSVTVTSSGESLKPSNLSIASR
jgi:beta-mannosidase